MLIKKSTIKQTTKVLAEKLNNDFAICRICGKNIELCEKENNFCNNPECPWKRNSNIQNK